jgi:hypothetical protein
MNKKIASAPHIDGFKLDVFQPSHLAGSDKTDAPLLERLSFLGIFRIIWMNFQCTMANPQSHCRV